MDSGEVLKRWVEYFDELLNNENGRSDDPVAQYSEVRSETASALSDELITEEEIRKVLARMKTGRAPGIDGCMVEFMKLGGDSIIKWLRRILNVCFVKEAVPTDWRDACVVPLYKGKGDKHECASFRGISLLSVVGKLYGKILVERIRCMTDIMFSEEQCRFRSGRSCVDQILSVKQTSEKYFEKRRDCLGIHGFREGV